MSAFKLPHNWFLVSGFWFLVFVTRLTFPATAIGTRTGNNKPETRNLFVSKRLHRIHFRRPSSWHKTGSQSHSRQNQRSGREGCDVCRADAKQQTRHHAAQGERGYQSEPD